MIELVGAWAFAALAVVLIVARWGTSSRAGHTVLVFVPPGQGKLSLDV